MLASLTEPVIPHAAGRVHTCTLVACFLFLLLLVATCPVSIKLVSGANIIRVPTDFDTIQEAVDNAANGDTIVVDAAIYREHVHINKSITLQGVDPVTTIIDGTANGTILTLEASDIYITGFTLRNAGLSHNAITSERDKATSDYHVIFNNIITTSQSGVYLSESNRNNISNNAFFENNFNGIHLNSADRNDIIGNTLTEHPFGIKLQWSTDNTIAGNMIQARAYGIYMSDSSTGNTASQNVVSAGTAGIYSMSDGNIIHHNTLTECDYGIYFFKCKNGEIYYNTLANNSYGIRVWWDGASPTTTTHEIHNNKAIDNVWAIDLTRSASNTLTGNWLQDNTYGVALQQSSFNTLYHNNFVRNALQAYSTATNYWDNGAEGNYWSDYEGEDIVPPYGIGDTPHPIIPDYDNYPLMDTWSEHDVSIENVTLSMNATYAGLIVDITVTVKNKGKISPAVSETFNVTAKYDGTIIETQTVANLAQGADTVLTFNWNTTDVAQGNYTIAAEASAVPDELNTDNNRFIADPMLIAWLGDVNFDGTVNDGDLALLVAAYGSTPTSSNWNSDADLSKDSVVDASDLNILSNNYGKTA